MVYTYHRDTTTIITRYSKGSTARKVSRISDSARTVAQTQKSTHVITDSTRKSTRIEIEDQGEINTTIEEILVGRRPLHYWNRWLPRTRRSVREKTGRSKCTIPCFAVLASLHLKLEAGSPYTT